MGAAILNIYKGCSPDKFGYFGENGCFSPELNIYKNI